MARLDNDKLKQSIFIIVIFAWAGLLFFLAKGFFSAFLGALVFYIVLRRPFFYFTERSKRKWNKSLVILLLLFVSFLVLIVPVFLVSFMLAGKVGFLISHYQDMLQMIQQFSEKAREYIGVDILSPDSVGKLTTIAANSLPKFLSETLDALMDIFVLYFLLYFMFANARPMEDMVRKYLPFHEDNNQLLLRDLKQQTIANTIGIPLLALIIGVVATMGYWIFGVEQPIFWGLLTGIGSAIPVVGMVIVWLPMVIFVYASGHHIRAVELIIYSLVTFSIIENLFRIMFLEKFGNVHPIVTFFGVFLGIEIFGFVGIIFGPLLISYFILLLKIYNNEYLNEQKIE